jgi:ketosteroid isomerase-like protein
VRSEADDLLQAFARSDLPTIDRLCADDVLLWGTDAGEVWRGKSAVLAAFDGTFDLGVRWIGEPVVHDDWVAGDVEFSLDALRIPARVTMLFSDGRLVHAHYSTAHEEGE